MTKIAVIMIPMIAASEKAAESFQSGLQSISSSSKNVPSNLRLPAICRFCVGIVVPMPTDATPTVELSNVNIGEVPKSPSLLNNISIVPR